MIEKSLSFIKEQLNTYLKAQFSTEDDWVILAPVSELDADNNKKVAISLINLERDAAVSRMGLNPRSSPQFVQSTPPLMLNLYFLASVASDANGYVDALKLLDATMQFFHTFPLFTSQNAPELDASIEKLTIELVDLSFSESSQLWMGVGVKARPSVIYKARLIPNQQSLEETNRIDVSSNPEIGFPET